MVAIVVFIELGPLWMLMTRVVNSNSGCRRVEMELSVNFFSKKRISQLDFNDGNIITISDFQDINYDLGKRSPFLLIDFRKKKKQAISRFYQWNFKNSKDERKNKNKTKGE